MHNWLKKRTWSFLIIWCEGIYHPQFDYFWFPIPDAFEPLAKNFGGFLAVFGTYLISSFLHVSGSGLSRLINSGRVMTSDFFIYLQGLNFQIWSVLLSLGFLTWLEYNLRRKLASKFSACVLAKKCRETDDGMCQREHEYGPTTLTARFINGIFSFLAVIHLAFLGSSFDGHEKVMMSHRGSYGWSINHFRATLWISFFSVFPDVQRDSCLVPFELLHFLYLDRLVCILQNDIRDRSCFSLFHSHSHFRFNHVHYYQRLKRILIFYDRPNVKYRMPLKLLSTNHSYLPHAMCHYQISIISQVQRPSKLNPMCKLSLILPLTIDCELEGPS